MRVVFHQSPIYLKPGWCFIYLQNTKVKGNYKVITLMVIKIRWFTEKDLVSAKKKKKVLGTVSLRMLLVTNNRKSNSNLQKQ